MRRVLVVVAVVLVAAVAWVGVRGWLARGHLEDAADAVSTLQQQVQDGDLQGARDTLASVQQDTEAASDLTGDPVWGAFAAFPWGGQNFAAVGEASGAAAAFARDGGDGLLAAADAASTAGESLGSLDTGALRDAIDGLEQAQAALRTARSDVAEIDRSYLVGPVEQALAELEQGLEQTGDVARISAGGTP